LVVVFAAQAALAQNLLTNGGFESPTIGASSVSATSPTSWSCTLVNFNTGGAFLVNASAGGFMGVTGGGQDSFPAAEQGQQYLAIGNHSVSVVSQVFTVSTPATYLLSWDNSSYGSSPYAAVSPYEVAITNSSSSTVASLSSIQPIADVWTPETMSANLTAGTYTLSFTPAGPNGDACPLIDSVSLTAIPEPSTLTLLALGGVTILGRRRANFAGRRQTT
jgi:hypothetical protein